MKKFLKPTIFKISVMVILIAVVLSEPFLYRYVFLDASSDIDIIDVNLIVKGIFLFFDIVKFPINVLSPLIFLGVENSMIEFVSVILAMIILIVEIYLISCVINLLFNKRR